MQTMHTSTSSSNSTGGGESSAPVNSGISKSFASSGFTAFSLNIARILDDSKKSLSVANKTALYMFAGVSEFEDMGALSLISGFKFGFAASFLVVGDVGVVFTMSYLSLISAGFAATSALSSSTIVIQSLNDSGMPVAEMAFLYDNDLRCPL